MNKYCAVSDIADMVTVCHHRQCPGPHSWNAFFFSLSHTAAPKFTLSETFWSPCWYFCSFLGVPFVPMAVLGSG